MGATIKAKNNQLLRGVQDIPPPCNCALDQCPLDGQCRIKGVIYQATVETQDNEKFTYTGLTEKQFIVRYQKHQSSFRVHDPRNSTSLSKKILELQRNHILFEIKWKILQVASPYRAGSRECRLCSLEIFYILFHQTENSLNNRQELQTKCRHQNKFKLSKA